MKLGYWPSSPETNPQYVTWLTFFGLSYSKDNLEASLAGSGHEVTLKAKKDECLYLLTSSLATNDMTTLEDLEATPI